MQSSKFNSDKSITIVTAFFDIGRGDWSDEIGLSSQRSRSTQTYLSYFENLAKLDNEMIIFTSADLEPDIQSIREKKKTKIITIDLETEFAFFLKEIKNILKNEEFINKIPYSLRHNPEYWSEKYVLVTNLKVYFVNRAIQNYSLLNEKVAWVDFGYCRDSSILGNIKDWYYPFDNDYVHLFTLKKAYFLSKIKNPKFPHNKSKIMHCIFNNRANIIGGVIVAHQEKWREFSKLILQCQQALIRENIIDDDQGVYLLCNYKRPELFRLNYLGKDPCGDHNWLGTFQKFHI